MVTYNSNSQLEPVDERTPIDILEPEINQNDYREASIKMLTIMSLAMSYIIDSDNPLLACYGVCFALGLTSVLDTRNMQDIAKLLNVNDATVSWHARRFQQIAGLPESQLLKPSRKEFNKLNK